MRILSPIVQVPAGPVSYIRQDRSLSNAVAAQAVRDEASWLVVKPSQQVLEEPLGRGAISPLLHQNIQHDAMLIDGAPQVDLSELAPTGTAGATLLRLDSCDR